MVYAISDLHLPGNNDKTMDIFGSRWIGHWESIRTSCERLVKDDDIILIPGDISWAMYLEDAIPDLVSVSELPGKKVILRGNHDYWWNSIGKVRESLEAHFEGLVDFSLQ